MKFLLGVSYILRTYDRILPQVHLEEPLEMNLKDDKGSSEFLQMLFVEPCTDRQLPESSILCGSASWYNLSNKYSRIVPDVWVVSSSSNTETQA